MKVYELFAVDAEKDGPVLYEGCFGLYSTKEKAQAEGERRSKLPEDDPDWVPSLFYVIEKEVL